MKRTFQNRHIPEGHKFVWTHLRDKHRIIQETRCDLIHIDGDYKVASGLAKVNPRDTPSKKIGRDISRGRCLKIFFTKKNESNIDW